MVIGKKLTTLYTEWIAKDPEAFLLNSSPAPMKQRSKSQKTCEQVGGREGGRGRATRKDKDRDNLKWREVRTKRLKGREKGERKRAREKRRGRERRRRKEEGERKGERGREGGKGAVREGSTEQKRHTKQAKSLTIHDQLINLPRVLPHLS